MHPVRSTGRADRDRPWRAGRPRWPLASRRDRPGRVRKGAASTAFEPHTAPRARERTHFAHELAQMLEAAALARRMPGLVLLASNPFLGDLKAALGPAAAALLKACMAVDLRLLQGSDLEHRVNMPRRGEFIAVVRCTVPADACASP